MPTRNATLPSSSLPLTGASLRYSLRSCRKQHRLLILPRCGGVARCCLVKGVDDLRLLRARVIAIVWIVWSLIRSKRWASVIHHSPDIKSACQTIKQPAKLFWSIDQPDKQQNIQPVNHLNHQSLSVFSGNQRCGAEAGRRVCAAHQVPPLSWITCRL